jgi:hypothetical protein
MPKRQQERATTKLLLEASLQLMLIIQGALIARLQASLNAIAAEPVVGPTRKRSSVHGAINQFNFLAK